MEKEKLYLVREADLLFIEKHEDNSIEELTAPYANEFKNEDELLSYLVGNMVSCDGQLARSAEHILKIVFNQFNDIIHNMSEHEVEHIDFTTTNDLLLYMKNILSNLKE